MKLEDRQVPWYSKPEVPVPLLHHKSPIDPMRQDAREVQGSGTFGVAVPTPGGKFKGNRGIFDAPTTDDYLFKH